MKALEMFWQIHYFTNYITSCDDFSIAIFIKKSKSKFIYMSSYVHLKIIIKALQ
jgi:hypothetical protein